MFKILISDAIRNWNKGDKIALADYIANFVLPEIDENNVITEGQDYQNIIKKLEFIIDQDVKHLINTENIKNFCNLSFSTILIDSISRRADVRSFIKDNFEQTYNHIDFDVFENIDLDMIFDQINAPLQNTQNKTSTLVLNLDSDNEDDIGKFQQYLIVFKIEIAKNKRLSYFSKSLFDKDSFIFKSNTDKIENILESQYKSPVSRRLTLKPGEKTENK